MPKKLPRKYFPGHTARINLRKVDRWAEQWKAHCPYFDTWKEAHPYMLEKAEKEVKTLTSRLASAQRHLVKVQAMQEPEFKLESTT